MTMKWVSSENKITVVPKSVHGVPTYINHESDFGVHLGLHADGQFVAANMKSEDGREFSFMLHIMCVNPMKDPNAYPAILNIISITDFTNRQYMVKEDVFMGDQISYKLDELDIKTPISYIKGNKDRVHCATDLPDGRGRLEVMLDRYGHILDNCALGAFPLLNDEVIAYQFSIPTMKANGTLTLDGKTSHISGDAWLDRQWGDGNEDFVRRTFKWKWMNLNLDNGYRISVWDVAVHDKKENAWATVLSPEGVHMVVDIVPFSKGESGFWTSPKTGQIYPTKFKLEIPSLDAVFNVEVRDGMVEQEIVSPSGEDKYEAACVFTGEFMGKKVRGFNYLEMVGSFK